MPKDLPRLSFILNCRYLREYPHYWIRCRGGIVVDGIPLLKSRGSDFGGLDRVGGEADAELGKFWEVILLGGRF